MPSALRVAVVLSVVALAGCGGERPDPIYLTEYLVCPKGGPPAFYDLPERPRLAADFDAAWTELDGRHRAFAERYAPHLEARDECKNLPTDERSE